MKNVIPAKAGICFCSTLVKPTFNNIIVENVVFSHILQGNRFLVSRELNYRLLKKE